MARILIIEDDVGLVQTISFALLQEGYEAHYAFNGKEGYEKIISLHPDLVLLDLMMPVLAGTDVLKLVSQNAMIKDIPIIVMTAYWDQANLLERSIKAQGAREYLKKPFDNKELVSTIRRILRQSPPAQPVPAEPIARGAVRLDLHYRTVWINDRRTATLPPQRMNLLRVLLESSGPVERTRLMEAVWGREGNDSVLEKTIQRLREDLGPEEGRRLQTRPRGYELICT